MVSGGRKTILTEGGEIEIAVSHDRAGSVCLRKGPAISEMIVEARANDGALEVEVLSLEPFKLEVRGAHVVPEALDLAGPGRGKAILKTSADRPARARRGLPSSQELPLVPMVAL